MERSGRYCQTVIFFDQAIREIASYQRGCQIRVLDFGSGTGQLVRELTALGYDAHGCDIYSKSSVPERCHKIGVSPYRLPFDDETFDVIVSTSVLEHAKIPASTYLSFVAY